MENIRMKKNKGRLVRKVYKATNSFFRGVRRLSEGKNKNDKRTEKNLRIAFIHNQKRMLTGAHQVNQTLSSAIAKHGIKVRNFYPRAQLLDTPLHLKGITSILFFHSLLEKKEEILKHHIIQGTTYTTLPFLSFNIPTISHFGSTTAGFLSKTPKNSVLPPEEKEVWRRLHHLGIVPSLTLETFRPLVDIAEIEKLVANRVTKCVATSVKVKEELLAVGVSSEKIKVIHNALEDYWFEQEKPHVVQTPHIVFLGRLGGDVFTLKLKGLSRLIRLYEAFPNIPKTTVCMTNNKKLKEWLKVSFPCHYMYVNLKKDLIPRVLSKLFGSVIFIPSRYEGFSLSLVEGMSQGLVPISYDVGVAPEIIKNGHNGFLVSSHEEACDKLNFLLSDDKRRIAMAEAAQKSALIFRSEEIASSFIDLYKETRREWKQSGKT